MVFLDKNDYFSFVIITSYAICFYFIASEFFDHILFNALFLAAGGLVGYLVAKESFYKSKIVKIILIFIAILVLVLVAAFSSESSNQEKLTEIVSTGIWVTDDDDVVIKMRFTGNDSVYVSMSPDFDEVGYLAKIKDSRLVLERHGIKKFDWEIEISESSFLLLSNSEMLEFQKVE
jgi:uncharacterized membrane protein YvbJ